MKVIIDISPLKSGHKTRGIGIYTRRLVEALHELDKKNKYILTTKSQHIEKADLIHYPYFDLFFHSLPIRKKTKSVVTIHDVIPLIFPQEFPPGIRGKFRHLLQKKALESVDAIITDSENSKLDIISKLNINESKISVIYLAAPQKFRPQSQSNIKSTREKYKIPENYVLYVGDVNPNKNVLRLIESFERIHNRDKSLHLVLVGRAFGQTSNEAKAIKKRIIDLNLQDRVSMKPNVPLDPSDDIISIYSGAKAYIHPSLYEGFGLPILEAFSVGVPVVAGNSSSVPEIASDAAILVNPESVKDIANGLMKILTMNEVQREKMITKGLNQAKKFSWEKTAKQTIQVYEKVLAEGQEMT